MVKLVGGGSVIKGAYPVSEGYGKKLDGVGPIDNRPSTKQLQHFEEEKNKIKKT